MGHGPHPFIDVMPGNPTQKDSSHELDANFFSKPQNSAARSQ